MKKSVVLGIIVVGCFIVMYWLCNDIIDNNDNNRDMVKFSKCVDGDTAYFIVDGKREKVRFLGVDTPEYDEEYGSVSSNYTCDRLSKAQDIYLEYDSNSKRRDKYDRLLAWVFVDNSNFSIELVEKGYARVRYIYSDYKYNDKLCDGEYKAYSNRLGIWNIGKYDYNKGYCSNNKK